MSPLAFLTLWSSFFYRVSEHFVLPYHITYNTLLYCMFVSLFLIWTLLKNVTQSYLAPGHHVLSSLHRGLRLIGNQLWQSGKRSSGFCAVFFFSQATSACEYSDAFLCTPLLFRRLHGRVSPTSSCHGFLHNWTLWVFFQPLLSVGTPAWRWRVSFTFMAWEAPHWNAFLPGNGSREVRNRRKAEKERGSFLNPRVLWIDCCEHSGGPCRDGAGVPLPRGGDRFCNRFQGGKEKVIIIFKQDIPSTSPKVQGYC